MSEIPLQPRGSPFNAALTNVASIGVLLILSSVTWEYRRALEPQYGSAPTSLHLTKVVWSSCILGSFSPTVPIAHTSGVLALLLYALPYAAYWLGAYTARLGDPVWGPVATHLLVLLPVLSLGVALIKALQELTRIKDDANAPQASITLPVCATALNATQGLWASIPYIVALPYNQFFFLPATVFASFWAVAPYMPDLSPPPPIAPSAPITFPATPEPKGKRKKGGAEKAPKPVPPPVPKPKAQTSSGLSKFRLVILPVLPFLAAMILRPPTLEHPLPESYTHPSYPLRILSSVESPYSTVVVVGETMAANPDEPGSTDYLRYLRAGHSLLGGVWVGPRAQSFDPELLLEDEAGEKLGDTIYSAFVVQEAALLAQKQPKNALIMYVRLLMDFGLGTGVAATSFMRQGIDTTIVEIDQAVYDAARKYFGLPPSAPEKVVIRDARGWVHNRSATIRNELEATAEGKSTLLPAVEKYDVIVHDCFTGGGVPAPLYTQRFWEELKDIMTPDAVVAVNYAGMLTSKSAKAIILTLRSVFPQCRAFYDSMETPADINAEFVNWVFFCSPSSAPLEFRKPGTPSFLGSLLRRHVLTGLAEREGDISAIGQDVPEDKREQLILKDAGNPLGEWQQKDALGHWKIMRSVLPDVLWETY